MARIAAVNKEDKAKRLLNSLCRYGVREPTAREIVKVYENRGSGQALIELYRRGWAIRKQEDGSFLLVRNTSTGEELIEEIDGEESNSTRKNIAIAN